MTICIYLNDTKHLTFLSRPCSFTYKLRQDQMRSVKSHSAMNHHELSFCPHPP